MTPNRLKLILAAVVIVAMGILLIWSRADRAGDARTQAILDRADRDAAAAQSAADSAARSAADAIDAARGAQNAVPGSS